MPQPRHHLLPTYLPLPGPSSDARRYPGATSTSPLSRSTPSLPLALVLEATESNRRPPQPARAVIAVASTRFHVWELRRRPLRRLQQVVRRREPHKDAINLFFNLLPPRSPEMLRRRPCLPAHAVCPPGISVSSRPFPPLRLPSCAPQRPRRAQPHPPPPLHVAVVATAASARF